MKRKKIWKRTFTYGNSVLSRTELKWANVLQTPGRSEMHKFACFRATSQCDSSRIRILWKSKLPQISDVLREEAQKEWRVTSAKKAWNFLFGGEEISHPNRNGRKAKKHGR